MSTNYGCHTKVLWITLQLLVLVYPDPRGVMAIAQHTPYVSEFEYASHFHPSKNPNCPTSGWVDNLENNVRSRRYRRSPEEGAPVGQEPSIEVRAILVRCPKTVEEKDDVMINRNVYNITAGRSQDILDFHGFDRDEPAHHSEVRDCRRKIIITMKFNNIGRTKTQEEFVVIDHVLDPVTMHKARLLNPFVVKVRQEPILQLYGLKFQGVVNAEAREEVINKKLSNYTGCDDVSDNPTCGQMFFEGKPIPYSQGFCCSCDPELNVQRQNSLTNQSIASSFPSFFSKGKENSIRPYKSTRSVNPKLSDNFVDFENTNNFESSNEDLLGKDLERFYQPLVNSSNTNFNNNVRSNKDENSKIDNSYDDERDLIDLKKLSESKKKNRGISDWKWIFGKTDDETTIEPQIVLAPPGTSRRSSNSSKSIDRVQEMSPYASQKSFNKDPKNNEAISQFRSHSEETFPNREQMTNRVSSTQNSRSLNIAAELTKLEEDYKNLRLSSMLKSGERNNGAKVKMQIYDAVGNSSEGRSKYNQAKHFIGMDEKAMTKNYGRESTMIIDIKLAIRPKEKSLMRLPIFDTKSTSIFPQKPLRTTQFPQTERPAVLRQKITTYRVDPAKGLAHVDFHSTESPVFSSQKIHSDVADLLAEAVMSENEENFYNAQTSNDDVVMLENTYNATRNENSITESSNPFVITEKNLPSSESPGTIFDNPSNQVESPTDSASSFSSGNLSLDDAIVLSGSLKNQLANWFSHEEGNNFELESSTKKLNEHVGQDSEVPHGEEVGENEPTNLSTTGDNLTKGNIRNEDRATTTVRYRRPVEVHLASENQYNPNLKNDEEITTKTRQRGEKDLNKDFLDYSIPAEMNFGSSRKSTYRNSLRSYRSVDKDEALFIKNNDRQRKIDQQIENEFEEISDVLKDAADGPKIMREKPKSEANFEQDNSVVRKFAKIFEKIPEPMRNNPEAIQRTTAQEENRLAHTGTWKQTETVFEPVSEIMLTTEHEIIVDRFQINKDLQEIPISDEKTLQETLSRDSNITKNFSKLRDRKQESSVTAPPISTTIKNEPTTVQISEIFQTTDHRIIINRFKAVKDFKEIADNIPLQKQRSMHPTFGKVSATIPDVDCGKKVLTTVISDERKADKALSKNRDTSFRIELSPVLMIKNLKKELRKEAERYSSISIDGSTTRCSKFEEFREHAKPLDKVREVNTALTPAEKVEDLITDEETLPPDEETKYTTDSMSKSAYFGNTTNGTSSIESSTINQYSFPELSIQSFDAKFINNNRDVAHRRPKKVLILLEESTSSSTLPSVTVKNKRKYKKRLHRRHNRRKNRQKKHSIKKKRNTVESATVMTIVKGRSENEDDEHPWYDTTIIPKATDTKNRGNDLTIRPVTSTTVSDILLQNRKRRFYIETPFNSEIIQENDERANEVSNESIGASTAGKFHLSITEIPEGDYHAGLAGLKIEEIPKNIHEQSASSMNFVEAKISSISGPEKLGEVDEMPLFRDTQNFNTEKLEIQEKIAGTSERSKRNLHTLFAGKLFNSRPLYHAGTRSKDIDRSNKRNYPMGSYESEPKIQIFYDYDNSGSSIDARNSKRDLNSFVSKNRLPVNLRKNHNNSGNSDDSRLKSSLGVPINSNGRFIMKRKSSMSRNHRLDGRSDEEIVSTNGNFLRKDFSTESSGSLSVKGHSRENCTVNQFGMGPSDGWKEKMELLKLKKHADVLKEYLNWRQDVASVESQGIPGYTTRISLTNTRDGQTGDFFTTDNSHTSGETTLPSVDSTYSTFKKEFMTTVEQTTNTNDVLITSDEHSLTNITTNPDTIETSVTVPVTDLPKNSSDLLTTTIKQQMPTNCPDKIDEGEASTGRILPPCGHQNDFLTTCHAKQESITSSAPFTSTTGRSHGKYLSDLDKDLIIISVLEKNLLKNKNQFREMKRNGTSSRSHRVYGNVASPSISRHHRRRHKSKKNKIPVVRKSDKIRYTHRIGRKLMSFEDSDENNNAEEYLTYEDDNEKYKADSSNENDNFNGEEIDSELWNKKWNRMIDKIMHENSTNSWKSLNSSKLMLKENASDGRSAMQRLRFHNADKYIRQIAKNIVHNTNIHESKNAEGKFVNEAKTSRRKESSRRHRPARRREFSRRKLLNHPIRRRKVIRDSANDEEFGNYEDKRSALRVLSKMDDLSEDKRKASGQSSYPEPRNADVNATTAKEISEQSKGRDFAISLSGKIHVEGGTNGQPMSISFDTSPEIQHINETTNISSIGVTKFDNATKNDSETAQNTNFLSSLFNIASVPNDLAHNSPEENKNVSANPPIPQSVRNVDEKNLRSSRENHRKKYRKLSKNQSNIRKSRAVDNDENSQKISKYRNDESYDLGESENLANVNEDSKEDDYEGSLVDDYYSDIDAYDDARVASPHSGSPSSGCPKIGRAQELSDHRANRPEVKVIKIIPLNAPKSSRMTASQMPKMNDDLRGVTVKPGKIKPAPLPWGKNGDEKNSMSDIMDENNYPPGSCSSQLESSDEIAKNTNDADESSTDRQITTSNPVNLKVIGLISMKQPSDNPNSKLDLNSKSDYEIVPLVHVKIEQQSENRDGPFRPIKEPNSDIDATNSLPDSHPTQSSCSEFNNEGFNKQSEDNTHHPEVATLNMDNDEELREPIQIGSCPASNRKDTEILPDYSSENKPDQTPSTKVLSPCADNQEMNTPKIRFHNDPSGKLISRKKIRLKNMLAIMEFMKKIKEIINTEEAPELSRGNDKDFVIKLEKVVVRPNNRSSEISEKIEGPEVSTDRVVKIAEGARRKPSSNGIFFERNFGLLNDERFNDTNDPSNSVNNFNEIQLSNKSKKANEENSETNPDKNFLFYEENDELRGQNNSDVNYPYRGNDNSSESSNQEDSTDVHRHNIRLIEKLKNAQNVENAKNNEDNFSADVRSENLFNPYPNQGDSESNSKVALKNFEKRIIGRYQNSQDQRRNDNSQENVNDLSTNKRNEDNDFSLISERKPHQSSIHRMRYDRRNERDATGKIYRRRRLLPIGRDVSHLTNRKFVRYSAAKTIPKENHTKKKKKKKRKHKKKKKKKKKKGKSHGEVAVKGRAWWPFGRQLMSVSEERGLILDSNFDRNKVELVENKRYGNRRISLPFDSRRKRRIHRAKYPHVRNKKHRRKHKKRKKKKKMKKIKKSKGEDKKNLRLRNKRQINPGGTQVRGGQDCMDRRHPSNVNPAKYLESAHCLRFSDMWYSVYELESPIMEHTVYLQLFEKHSLEDGTTHWDDLTQGTMVRMGSFTRHQRDSKPTIAFTYSGAKIESQKRALNLDPVNQRLLVPSPVPTKSSRHPDAKSGLGEYLVVQSSSISKDGNDCDKAGVGFAAFAKQEDRCGRSKDSCLKNQPLAYWRHDTEARESGRPGCYFLSNFATVPTNPIKYNVSGSGSREYLGLEYHSVHVSAIDIEVRTDYNAIIRVGSSGRVTEVYVDSTALEHTVVTVVISNMGLASSPYQPRITDCPAGLPVSWSKAKGIMQVVPPQHDQRVTLDLYGQLLINGFHCSVEVVNHRGELVAMRRIRVQKMDRCFCVWHCLCACIGSVSGMGCQPMSPEHYHAAGFQGPVPVVTTETSILMNAVKDVLMLSSLLVLLLLLLGILKWFVGMFVPAVGRWGLDSLLNGSRIEKYLEPELKCRCVVTDDNGAPVHPDTGQRTVRICSRKLEFVLNLIFFLTYPIAMCCTYFKRSLNESKQRRCCPDESKMCLINEKESCPKMICVSTYGDSRNTKLEAEDTRYVMNELRKSQESLENPKRMKKNDSHTNRSDKNLSKKSSRKNKSVSDVKARKFVDDLLKKRVVFRNLTEPIGGLSIPIGIDYSLRGYFLNAEDGGYRFITPCPFKQHWHIVNNEKIASKPPEIYESKHFMRSYGTARDVYESNELSLTPRGVCVNVQHLDDT